MRGGEGRQVAELEGEKADLGRESAGWKAQARAAEESLAVKSEEVEALGHKLEKLGAELEEVRAGAAKATAAAAAAETQRAMAVEKLNHVAAEVTRVNEDNVGLRAQAHGAVQEAKEARVLLEEVEALRQKEERRWLQAQEEETKRQAALLTTKVHDLREKRASRGPMGPRVFWSSSVSDFAKERAEARDVALPRLQEVCGRRGLVLTVMDLRCGFADSDAAVGRVMPMLLEEIDLCTYFSCFLGQQYGCYPQNMKQVAGTSATKGQARVFYEAGATALEAAHVLEQKLRWGRRAFFYLRDPRSVDHVQAPVEVPLTPETEEAQQALVALISASGLKLTLNYRSAEDGVAAWEADLAMAIAADYPLPAHCDHVPNSVDGWRPASLLELLEDGAHAAALETRLARHVTTASLAAVVAALHDHVTRQEGAPLLLTGAPGSGKATALAVFLDQYKREVVDSGTEAKALVCGLSTRAVHTTPVNLLRTMMRRLKLHFMIDAPALPEAAADILSHGTLFSWLELGALEAPVLFGLDLDGFVEREHASAEEAAASSMAWLSSAQPLGANLLVSTSQPAAVRTATERFFWPTVTMELLPRQDTVSIVEQYLGSRGIEVAGPAQAQLWELRQEELSSPLFLSLLLLEWQMLDLVGWRHEAHIARILVIRSPHPDKACALLFNLMLDRWEEEYETGSRQMFSEVFSLLVLARAGLSWEELLGLTGMDPALLAVFLHKARDLLANKTGRYVVQHQVVAQALEHRYLNGTAEVGAVRATLVDFFRERGFASPHACLEIPYQLYQQQQLPELRAAIETLGVFNAFFSSGLEPELLHYWSLFSADADAKTMAQVYQKGLAALESAAAEGLSSPLQLQRFGVAVDSLHTMASVLSQLGRFLGRSGQNLASIQVLERLVEVYTQLKPNSIQLASAAQRVAAACFRIGFFEQGLPCAEKCLEIHLHVSGPDSIQVADALQVQALLCLGLNQLEKAAAQMQASLKVREAVLGRDHPSVAEGLLHASKIALRQGSAAEAKDLQLRANKLMGARARKATRTRKEDERGGGAAASGGPGPGPEGA